MRASQQVTSGSAEKEWCPVLADANASPRQGGPIAPSSALPHPRRSSWTVDTECSSSSTSASTAARAASSGRPPHVPNQLSADFFFFGRDEELQHLRNTRQRIHDNQPIFPAALVWGTSGTGKSLLIEHFLNRTCCSCGVRGQLSKQSNKPADQQQSPSQGSQQRCSCCYMMRGKYDEYTGNKDPFSAIIQALDDFATQLQQGSADELERVRRCVQSAFATDTDVADQDQDNITHDDSVSQMHIGTPAHNHSAMAALIAVVPSLSILVSDTVGSSSSVMTGTSTPSKRNGQRATSNNDLSNRSVSTNSVLGHAMSEVVDVGGDTSNNAATANSQSAWNRLCYIFIQFMKAISTPQRPVYLFLDDLQWSSAAGLELLASLLTDTGLNDFMLLGAIRQETDPHNHQAMELSPYAPLQTSFLDRLLSQDDVNIDVNQSTRQLEQITLGDLSVTDCTQWLSRLLHRSRDDDDLKVLVSKIHNKTHGNVYFTLQAIEELKRRGIILHNRNSKRWEWDLNQSTGGGSDLPIGDNIVAIIEMQLKDQPHDLQYALSVAAYIRSTFDIHVLQVVLQHVDDHGGLDVMFHRGREGVTAEGGVAQMTIPEASAWTIDRLHSVLDKALLEGLVTNSIGESRYHFAHDRVQQAAHGLIPFGEARNKLRLQIGHCLLDIYRKSKTTAAAAAETLIADQEEDQEEGEEGHDDAEGPTGTNHEDHHQQEQQQHDQHLIRDVDSLLFIAADHLNSMPTKDHLFLVTFNLEVGQKALQMAALSSAAAYLQKASVALQRVRNPWEDHYDLCLELFRCRSEVELSLGNFETGHNIGNAIIKKARTLDDKLPTYFVMAKALGREGKVAESLSMSLSVARNLGESPRRFYLFHVANDLMRIKAFLKNNTDEDILNLPVQSEFRTIMAMKFVHETEFRSFFSGAWLQWLVHALKQIRMTLRYGICDDSAPAFAVLSIIFDITNEDRSLVVRCAGIAHRLLRKAGQQASSVFSITAGWIYPSSEKFFKCVKSLDRGYSLAMEAGEVELGLTNLRFRDALAFYVGYKLQPLVDALENTLQQHKVYNVAFSNEITIALLMMSKYLTGADPVDWNTIERKLQDDVNDISARTTEVHRLIATYSGLPLMAATFRKHELAQRMLKLYNGLSENAKGYHFNLSAILAQGLSASALYRSTNKAKYKKELTRQIEIARHLAKKGSNTMSLLQLLKAEKLSLKGSTSRIATIRRTEDAYSVAIMMAEKASLTHYCAIACERLAEYLIGAAKALPRDTSGASDQSLRPLLNESIRAHMTRALNFYNEWGCSIKVKDIQQRRFQFLSADARDEMPTQSKSNGRATRMVDTAMGGKQGFVAGLVVANHGAQRSRNGLDISAHGGKRAQSSAKGSVFGNDGMMSFRSSAHGEMSHAHNNSHNDDDGDSEDDVSVLTYGSH